MTKVTIAKGDGIGPEIMEATLKILKAAGVPVEFEEVAIGEKVYLAGNTAGIAPESWATLRRNKVILKAPITTPQGGGYKSLNVSMRKALGLYANVRPCRSLSPYVETKHPVMDLVIIRENEEDLYAGIEHQQTAEVVQCLKLVSRPGCEKIVRYAFEYAKQYGRKKVTCLSKDNIMKQTDGLFHSVFNEIAAEYPGIETDHWIIDIGAARIADMPETFDVIVTLNLYGDIISDIAAQITGSVGMAGSSNVGEECAMFEAIHGSAPTIAGQGIANPSGLLQGAVMMLNHIGENKSAETIENAWLKTIEDGIHTGDIYEEGTSTEKVGTAAFADAVIARLGQQPQHLTPVEYKNEGAIQLPKYVRRPADEKKLEGVDVFMDWAGTDAAELGAKTDALSTGKLKLSIISNRGIEVWPGGFPETFCTDHWRCRYLPVSEEGTLTNEDLLQLLQAVNAAGLDVIKTENLYSFGGKKGYSV